MLSYFWKVHFLALTKSLKASNASSNASEVEHRNGVQSSSSSVNASTVTKVDEKNVFNVSFPSNMDSNMLKSFGKYVPVISTNFHRHISALISI